MGVRFIGNVTPSNNSGTSGDWSLPAGWREKDLALFWWYCNSSSNNITPPGTVTTKHETSSSEYGRLFVGYRSLVEGDSTFTWSATFGAARDIWGTSVYRDTPPDIDPFEAESGSPALFTAQDPDPSAVTPLGSGAAVVVILGRIVSPASNTPSADYTLAGFADDSGEGFLAGTEHRLDRPGLVTEDPGTWTLGGGGTANGIIWTAAIRPWLGGGGQSWSSIHRTGRV